MESKRKYYLQMADNAMVMSIRIKTDPDDLDTKTTEQRIIFASVLENFAREIYREISQWQPEREQEIFTQLMERKAHEFYNSLLVELDISDQATRVIRQYFFETYAFLFLLESMYGKEVFLQNIAKKYLPLFHRQMLLSKRKIESLIAPQSDTILAFQNAVFTLWSYVQDLFQVSLADIEMYARQHGIDLEQLKLNWEKMVAKTLESIQVKLPVFAPLTIIGKEGQHTKNFHLLLNKEA